MAQGPRGEQRVSPLQWIPKSLLSQPSQPSPHSFSLPPRPRAQRSSERGPGIPPVLQALEPVIHWPRVTQHTRGSTGIRTQACVTAKPPHPHQGQGVAHSLPGTLSLYSARAYQVPRAPPEVPDRGGWVGRGLTSSLPAPRLFMAGTSKALRGQGPAHFTDSFREKTDHSSCSSESCSFGAQEGCQVKGK